MIDRFLDALFPSRCVGCATGGVAFCIACWPELREQRTVGLGDFDVVAVGRYGGVLRRAILAYKHGRRDVGEALGSLFVARVAAGLPDDAILVPVPTVASRGRLRGFHQSVMLARALARATPCPALLVLRQNERDAQRGRTRDERLRARDRFVCTIPELVAEANVVLVDDVVTTGATLRDCARALEAVGAVVAGAVVLAYAS